MTGRSHRLAAVGAQVFKLQTRGLVGAFGDINNKASCESLLLSPEGTTVSPDLVVARRKD